MSVLDSAYPAVMDHKLRRIRRRQLALALVRAMALAAVAFIMAMLAAMAIDGWCTLFHSGIRVTLTVAAFTAALVTLFATAAPSVGRALGLRRVAEDVDQQVPHLEQRWRTVADFAESNHRPRDGMAEAMLRQVTTEAVAMGRLVEPARVARTGQIRRAAIWLTGSVALLLVFLLADWPRNQVLVQRFWAPLSAISATQATSLSGDIVVPRGEPVDLVFKISGLPRASAVLLLTADDDQTTPIDLPLDPNDANRLVYHVPALDASFRYQLQAGDGRTPWHSVTAIDRPSLDEVKLTLTPPEYVGRPTYEKNYLPQRLSAIQGSRLRLELKPAGPLERLELLLTRRQEEFFDEEATSESEIERLSLAVDADGWYRYRATLEENVSISLALLSEHGLTNEDRPECHIRVIPDRAPVARVLSPTEETTVSPDEVLEVKFDARDDYGIARAELVVYQESTEGEPPTILSVEEIPLGDQQFARHVHATAQLDLSKFPLTAGSNISFAIRVTDNRPPRLDEMQSTQKADGSQQMPERSPSGSQPAEHAADTESTEGELPNAGDKSDDVATPRDNQVALAKPKDSDVAGESVDSSTDRDADAADDVNQSEQQAGEGQEATSEPADRSDAADERESQPGVTDGTSDQEPPSNQTEPAEHSADSDEGSAAPTAQARPTEPAAERAAQDEPAADGAATPAKSDAGDAGDSSEPPPGSDAPSGERPDSSDSEPPVEPSLPDSPEPAAEPMEEPAVDDRTELAEFAPDERRMASSDDLPGQNTESNRLRLKIANRTAPAAGQSDDRRTVQIKIRDRLIQIDGELQIAEAALEKLWETVSTSAIADPQLQELDHIDNRLGKVDRIIADLRDESRDTPYAFVGLQMVDIGSSYITPARDRVFALLRQPAADAEGNVAEAAHRVSRARELLAELLVRYERAVREQELAESLDEAAEMYEVYVANLQRMLRAQGEPSPNPLDRAMAILEVDQEYLDRLKQVVEMRRDLMSEFGRILGDDPRLLGKYMDIIKRRQTSLRDQLTRLHERQLEIAEEVAGWQSVDESQREEVWLLAAELRLHEAAQLAREVSQFEQRVVSQFPLGLDPADPGPNAVVERAGQLALLARSVAAKSRRLLVDPSDTRVDLVSDIDEMAFCISSLEAALDQLDAEYPSTETREFVVNRRAEMGPLVQQLAGWLETAAHLQHQRYHGLAKVDQQQLAVQTELLRVAMLGIDNQLTGPFQQEVPPSILAGAAELKQIIESITFNQAAATFDLESNKLAEAQTQQMLALAGFERAEELFDQLRRLVVDELDQRAPDNPNAADLEDPTLDQILARLEREPNLNALMGIPNRPTNLRVISDWMEWSEQGRDMSSAIEESARQARERAEEEQQWARRPAAGEDEDADSIERQWQEIADAESARDALERKAEALRAAADDPAMDEEEAEKLRKAAEQLEAMRRQLANRQIDDKQWREMVQSDQMKAILRAAARGEPLPDQQWNHILSSLDDGLWQVRRRTPPEGYREAIEQYQERIRKLRSLEFQSLHP